ncbi:MAG: right-handed parallel beta-helix repeat-containing protein, partial [Patescibacteria group bacterium]|nr:right-handed parallel beta-helix repeat-containing protein [Patescibacteria group bacterium]
IAPGTYNELLTLPDNIILYGPHDVTISQETVPHINTLTTGNNTKLINLTISGGNNSVLIPYNTSVTFLNTIISHANDFGVKMEKKKRAQTPSGKKATVTYEIFDKTNDEIADMPLVRFSNVTITKNDDQGMYLRDGRVEIINSKVIENGEEGIDLHPHMHTTIKNTVASNNGESGLETEIYDNVVTIENSTFTDNIKNGVAFLTSMGIGDITLTNNIITNNAKFGMRCAVHKNRPKKPRPFFQSVISWKDGNNTFENNFKRNIASECYTF